ncbi:MAG: photosystem II reaction center protein Psb28 [Okeania sp. SIO3I5]|uniref:photosystem II reaction center protein Psb28 n=1 Tax=Okeania sp. SIO3I5 TaxID=2607805 RepID=UPI0013BAB4BD|nr:photosystem II reaction center protein Psb28 [Okeania sp. SIO3I5]NEQ36675.1 photosystem II reaction center protein Psb28 [Okeania sp. SIO3I5]
MTVIQFIQGIDEEGTEKVRLTRSRDGNQGTATFIFEDPKALGQDVTQEITGMYMIDEEGQMITREVKAKFINGEPKFLEGFYVMKSLPEWERFMRFMERYAEKYNLGFDKA